MGKETITIDKIFRIISSIIYRLILSGYAIYILCYFDNSFQWYVYGSSILLYVVLSYLLLAKEKLKARLRLLLDYVFIGLVLYGKDLDNIIVIVFLLLPIFNTPNHSGKKRSYFLLYTTLLALYFTLNGHFKFDLITPVICLFLLSYLEYYRSRALGFYYSLNNSVLDLYESKRKFHGTYEVYKDIINRFNQSKFSRVFNIDRIIYITEVNGKYFLRNSSVFISAFEIHDFQIEVQKEKGQVTSTLRVTIDGEFLNNVILIPVKIHNKYNYFILVVDYERHLANIFKSTRDKYYLTPCLLPFFRQLAVFFEAEHLIRLDSLEMFNKMEKEYEYVLRTINVVHFMRNRLTPFINYLEMSTDIKNDNVSSSGKLAQMKKVIVQENERAKSTLNEILSRINQILDASENPFNVSSDINSLKINKLFSEVRNLLAEILGFSDLETNLEPLDFEKEVVVSSKGIIILFSDLINNIKKYGNGKHRFLFNKEDSLLVISFENEFPNAKSKEVRDLVAYLNSDENNNIFKMSTKGAFLIKDFVRQMGVGIEAILDEKKSLLSIKLHFKIIK